MILLNVTDIRKHYGPEPVLGGVSFEVRPGDRLGLVGPNGTGKTTLLRIIADKEEADAGSCEFHPSAHLGYLEQQPEYAADRTLHDEARSALANLMAIQREAEEVAADMAGETDPAELSRLAARYDHLQHELQEQDAYNIDHRIERVLDGLRFRREAFNQPVSSLSGGEQNRLMLAKLLMAEPNLMILDEPSNHLDIEATEWLEQFLIESSAAMIVVSHDRYFLDKVTTRTLELFNGTVEGYVGNFSAYWRQKAERLLVQRRTFEKQQIEIEKTKDFIRRNQYGQKHAQAEDRRKKLERIELVAPPREIESPHMQFPEAGRTGDFVLRAKNVAKSYERPLFSNVSCDIMRGERWALHGPNGCGKTTLLRCLQGLIDPDAGTIQLGQGVTIGYFDQQLAELPDDMDVVDAVRPTHKQTIALERRNVLATFGLTGDTAMQKVGSLSGGERCRAALARLSMSDANFLILDEPTNHLDLWARDALEMAIKNFNGTVLMVSHDRYFVNRVADHMLVLDAQAARIVEGNYDAYQQLLGRKAAEALEDRKSENSDSGSNKSRKDQTPKKSAGKRRFAYRKVEDIEEEILARESAVTALQNELIDPKTLRNGDRVREIKQQIEQEQEAIQRLYEHWDEAAELNW